MQPECGGATINCELFSDPRHFKQECEECILRLWSGDEAGGSSGKGATEFGVHQGAAEAHRGEGRGPPWGGLRHSEGWPRPRSVVD